MRLSAIDPTREYTFREAARLTGHSTGTYWRWTLRGLGSGGRLVRLATVRRAGRRFVLGADLLHFLGHENGHDAGPRPAGDRREVTRA